MIDEVVLQAVYVSPSLVDRSIDLKVSAGELLEIEPPQLEFPFELEKQISCSIQLSNKTDDHVAFRSRESNWVDYIVRPSS
ncbi:vesicle-associated protein 3-1-like [Asparagus officinalis]|uniref:vesicle-associated protein 3-1-like n=1 Tax=Asparagus officinalis TaxID=4686 RepID=UPI00098DF464|nr:vesicle-associated protein 3-1-like [Asparagus officinalis]